MMLFKRANRLLFLFSSLPPPRHNTNKLRLLISPSNGRLQEQMLRFRFLPFFKKNSN